MSLQINMNAGAAANGGGGVGAMTAAGNPWTVPDALAHDLVNRGIAVPVSWPINPLATFSVNEMQAIAAGVPSRMSGPVPVAALGDSLTRSAIQSAFTINQVCYAAQGFMTWGVALSGGAVWCPLAVELGAIVPLVNYNRAVDGETIEQIRARVPELKQLPVTPRLVNILGGTNNLTVNPTQPAASITAEIIGTAEDVMALGMTPIVCTLFPRGNGTAAGWGTLTAGQISTARGRLLEINRRLRIWAAATPGVILADLFGALCNMSSGTSDAAVALQPDYLHTNAPGAVRAGLVWWQAVAPFVAPAADYYFGAGDAYSAADNQTGSMLTSSYSAGGGSAGTGASGTVPANMTVNRLSGSAATVVVGQQARADGKNGFEMTLAMTGLTDNAVFRSYEGTSVVPVGNFAAGDAFFAEQDVIFNGAGANQYGNPDITMRLNAGPIQVFAALNAAGAQGDMQGVYSFRLRTPICVVPAGGITSTNMWSLDGIKPGGAATVTRRPAVWRKYDKTAAGAITW